MNRKAFALAGVLFAYPSSLLADDQQHIKSVLSDYDNGKIVMCGKNFGSIIKGPVKMEGYDLIMTTRPKRLDAQAAARIKEDRDLIKSSDYKCESGDNPQEIMGRIHKALGLKLN